MNIFHTAIVYYLLAVTINQKKCYCTVPVRINENEYLVSVPRCTKLYAHAYEQLLQACWFRYLL